DLQLEPRREEVKQARARTQSRRRDDVVKVLVRNDVLPAGTPLTLQPTEVNEELRTQLSAWLDEDPSRAQGTWLNDVDEPIRWAYTDSTGKPTEPPRVARRLQTLRGWSHDRREEAGEVSGGAAGSGCSDGVRGRAALRLAVGGGRFGCREVGSDGGDSPQVGAAG